MRRTAGLLLAMIAMAACSASDSAPPPLETSPSITTAPTTEGQNPDDSTEPTIAVPEEKTTTSSPSTTLAPPTTVNEAAARLARIEEDWRTGYAAFMSALMDPNNEELLAAALDYRADENAETVQRFVDAYAEQAWRLTDRGVEPVLSIEGEPELSDDGFTAIITTCEVNGLIVVETAGAPDGTDATVDDVLLATRSEERLIFDTRWRVAEIFVLGQWRGVHACVG